MLFHLPIMESQMAKEMDNTLTAGIMSGMAVKVVNVAFFSCV